MQVSFGAVLQDKDGWYTESPRQKEVSKYVANTFRTDTSLDPKKYYYNSLSEAIDDFDTDVIITSKKNGNIVMSLRTMDENDDYVVVKNPRNNRPIQWSLNLKNSTKDIKKNVDRFVEMCNEKRMRIGNRWSAGTVLNYFEQQYSRYYLINSRDFVAWGIQY